jgi:hypothetical protein
MFYGKCSDKLAKGKSTHRNFGPQLTRPLPRVLAPSCPVCFGDDAGNSCPAHLIDQRRALQEPSLGIALFRPPLPNQVLQSSR